MRFLPASITFLIFSAIASTSSAAIAEFTKLAAPICLSDATEIATKMAELHTMANVVEEVKLISKVGETESYSVILQEYSGTMRLAYKFEFLLGFSSPCTVHKIETVDI